MIFLNSQLKAYWKLYSETQKAQRVTSDGFNADPAFALGTQETLRDQVSRHVLSAYTSLENKDLRTQRSPLPITAGFAEQKQDVRHSASW